VTLACLPAVRAAVAGQLPEVTFLLLPGRDRDIGADAATVVGQALPAYDVLLIGPGLGRSPGAQTLVRDLLSSPDVADTPAVIDADGLNALARVAHWHETMTCKAVLTPHPGELGRLTHASVPEVQANRIATSRRRVEEWGQTVVLKGAQTVVAAPTSPVRLSPFANALLATAGTGDVLAGAIAGLMAQGVDNPTAAALGVYLHGAAGELLAQDYGASGLLASELGAGIAKAAAVLRAGGLGA
jgi:NAD(P)H-hydrate epimerase